MRLINYLRKAMVTTAMVGMLLPTGLLRAEDPGNTPLVDSNNPHSTGSSRVIDVALDARNVLRGNLVDGAGHPAELIDVSLAQNGIVVAKGQSNLQGEFAIANVAGGAYQVMAGDRVIHVRCWAEETAPPAAVASTLIQINDIQRGQIHPGSCLTANPWVAGAVIAAAIIIPVSIKAIRDNRDDNSNAGNNAGNNGDGDPGDNVPAS